MPDVSLMEGLKEFGAAENNGKQGSTSMMSKLMSELRGISKSQKPVSSLATTGEGLPSQCVEEILAGEFVDFADLPPAT